MHRKNGMSTFYAQILFCCILLIVSCSNDEKSERKRNISDPEKLFYNGIGVGPIKVLKLENSINLVLSSQGEKIFQSKCVTCHLLTEDRKIGPGLEGISLRRRPEWIMNQILNPLEMAIKDSLLRNYYQFI